jgi:hypothetical protein
MIKNVLFLIFTISTLGATDYIQINEEEPNDKFRDAVEKGISTDIGNIKINGMIKYDRKNYKDDIDVYSININSNEIFEFKWFDQTFDPIVTIVNSVTKEIAVRYTKYNSVINNNLISEKLKLPYGYYTLIINNNGYSSSTFKYEVKFRNIANNDIEKNQKKVIIKDNNYETKDGFYREEVKDFTKKNNEINLNNKLDIDFAK